MFILMNYLVDGWRCFEMNCVFITSRIIEKKIMYWVLAPFTTKTLSIALISVPSYKITLLYNLQAFFTFKFNMICDITV